MGDSTETKGHKSAASPDGSTGKTCLGGGMHSPRASYY